MWKSVYVNTDQVDVHVYHSRDRIRILEGLYSGYTFWHPDKLVKNTPFLMYEIVFKEDWIFKLQQTKKKGDKWEVVDEVELSADDFALLFTDTFIHIPEPLEPLENVEPLPELIDND